MTPTGCKHVGRDPEGMAGLLGVVVVPNPAGAAKVESDSSTAPLGAAEAESDSSTAPLGAARASRASGEERRRATAGGGAVRPWSASWPRRPPRRFGRLHILTDRQPTPTADFSGEPALDSESSRISRDPCCDQAPTRPGFGGVALLAPARQGSAVTDAASAFRARYWTSLGYWSPEPRRACGGRCTPVRIAARGLSVSHWSRGPPTGRRRSTRRPGRGATADRCHPLRRPRPRGPGGGPPRSPRPPGIVGTGLIVVQRRLRGGVCGPAMGQDLRREDPRRGREPRRPSDPRPRLRRPHGAARPRGHHLDVLPLLRAQPRVASYAATKAFNLILEEALWKKSSAPVVSTCSSSVPGRPGPRAGSRAAPTAKVSSRPRSWSPLPW